MNKWFTVKVKYAKQMEDGTIKNVAEPYLVAAETVTDAEVTTHENLGKFIRGQFEINSVTSTTIHDVIPDDDGEYWWKCKICYNGTVGDSEKVKKITQQLLVAANNSEEAAERIKKALKSTLGDHFTIPSLVETKIADVFSAN